MNEQASTMMNSQSQRRQHQQMMAMAMNQNQMIGMSQMNTQPQRQVIFRTNQERHFSNLMSSESLNTMKNSQPYPQMAMSRSHGNWLPPLAQPQFQNPKPNKNLVGMKPPPSVTSNKSSRQLGLGPRSNWKGKKVGKPYDKRRNDQQKPLMPGPSTGPCGSGVNVISGSGHKNFNYNPPTLNELQHQNRLKARKFFSKKNFNKNNNMNSTMGSNNKRFAPFAPRNTTSFLIRAKKSGGIAPLVSPYPVTPAILPTPIFSPSREVLVDMAKEEWGLDGYGSMKGLIRLRSAGHEMEVHEDEEEDEGGSSESDLEEHVEVERRLDHDLSRFEMTYKPNSVGVGGLEYQNNVLENKMDEQDAHIEQLEEENLILKDRLFLMERELGDLRRRLQGLERPEHEVGGEINEEVMENDSENESSSDGDETHAIEENYVDLGEYNQEGGSSKGNVESNNNNEGVEAAAKPVQNFLVDVKVKMETDKIEENLADVEVKEVKNNYEFVETNKGAENFADIDGKEETNIDENNQDHVGVETVGNVHVEVSEPAARGANVFMELVRQAGDKEMTEYYC